MRQALQSRQARLFTGWLRRSWATVLVGLIALAVGMGAYLYPGIKATELTLHDGSVFVVNQSKALVGTLNYQINQIATATGAGSGDLQVLQDGTFERVGGQNTMTVDVRIIAATHRDLSGMVREGRFREDLWYRLAVFPISLPPLRERPEDIPALARHFAGRAATRFGLPPRMPTPEDISVLVSYSWPGNVRELIAVMDRAAILGDGHALEVAKALGVQTRQSTSANARPDESSRDGQAAGSILDLDEAMRRHIETALAATRGRIEGPSGTAALLKINPHTLRARMRKLGIDWNRFRG